MFYMDTTSAHKSTTTACAISTRAVNMSDKRMGELVKSRLWPHLRGKGKENPARNPGRQLRG